MALLFTFAPRNIKHLPLSGSEIMKQTLLHIIRTSCSSNSITISTQTLFCTIRKSESIHTLQEDPDAIVNTICNSLRKGLNWDSLSRNLGSVDLTNSIVEKVLLQLKEPIDAKRALGFFHWSSQKKQFKHEISTYCIAIHLSVRSKLIKDARILLESAVKKRGLGNSSNFSVVDTLLKSYRSTESIPLVFDLLVQTYAKLRMVDNGFDVCQYLDVHGFCLNVISYNTLIDVGQKSVQINLVWNVYEHMIKKRTYPNEVTVKIMVSALCKEGKLQESIDILDRTHGKRCSPAVIVNTSLVFRMLEEGRVEEGMVLLKRMLQKNMILDTIASSLIISARVKLGSLDSAWELYEEMLKKGFRANSFIYTLFIGAYCKEGRVEDAIHLMREMENTGLNPYNETFDHLIVGCSKNGRLKESVKFCEILMQMGLVPSSFTFNELIRKLGQAGGAKHANEMLTDLLDKGFQPDEVTYSLLIAGYAKQRNIQEVLKLYYEMEYRSLSPGSFVFESLVSCLCQHGNLDDAERYLKVMKDRSIPPSSCTYERMISSHHFKGNKIRAHQLYNEMVAEGLKSNSLVCCVGANKLQC